MQINANIEQLYQQKIAERGKSRVLDQLAQEFLAQIKAYPGTLNRSDLRLGLAEAADYPVVNKLAALAYGWRYGDKKRGALVDPNFAGHDNQYSTTLVAKIRRGDQELILLTARLVRQELELYQFFKFSSGQTWSDYLAGRPAYEVERLAFHPLFELGDYREFQLALVPAFYAVMRSLIKEQGAWLGCTMRRNVKKFIERSGLVIKEIPGLEFTHNAVSAHYLKLYPHYFEDFYAYTLN